MMKGSFYGWYFKCQSDSKTLAIIPAVHHTGQTKTCSIQIITDINNWTVTFPAEAFQRKGKNISIGENSFGENGVYLTIEKPNLSIQGILKFGSFSPLKYDIMGPFAFIPYMECRHSVWSMKHSVFGEVQINGEKYTFNHGFGYWEGDQGRSFPKEYLWTQCFFPLGSLMLSVADIPMAAIRFTGIIGVVLWQGKEYRLATYLGAKVISLHNKNVHIIQGDLELEATLIDAVNRPLQAPTMGAMVRTIHESASCYSYYRFKKNGRVLFEFHSKQASFEYEYPS